MNNILALILAVVCFAGFILLVDAKKRKALQDQIDDLKRKK